MRKIAAVVLSYLVFLPASYAADELVTSRGSIEVNYGTYDVVGIQGEMNVVTSKNSAPVSVQAFLKHYRQDLGSGILWDTTGIGVAALYDFNSVGGLDKRIHPYGGVGLMEVSHGWSGAGPAPAYTGVDSGLYLTLGVKYGLSDQVMADLNYNVFGYFDLGIEFKF